MVAVFANVDVVSRGVQLISMSADPPGATVLCEMLLIVHLQFVGPFAINKGAWPLLSMWNLCFFSSLTPMLPNS